MPDPGRPADPTIAQLREVTQPPSVRTRAAAEHWVDRGLEPKPWYLWYTARLLDTAAEVAIAMGSPRASKFVEKLAELAGRSGMREFAVRAQSHRAVLGDEAAAQAVPWLAKEIGNPALDAFLMQRHGG